MALKSRLPLRAVSVWQPWADLIAHHGKNVENRTWSTRYRGPLAIHASGRIHPDTNEIYRHFGIRPPRRHVTGAIVAVAHLSGVHHDGTCSGLCSRWAEPDQYHWLIDPHTTHALRHPVPCRGALKLWAVPDDVARQVLGHARAGGSR